MCHRVQTLIHGTKDKHVLKVALIGDSGVGKSSLADLYVNGKFDIALESTVGCDCRTKNVIIDREPYKIVMWDTAGAPKSGRALRSKFYHGADCCVIVFALDDVTSCNNIIDWHNEFISYLDESEHSAFPFVVIGNKFDLVDRYPSFCVKDIRTRSGRIIDFETSVLDLNSVNEAFDEVMRKAKLYQDAKKLGDRSVPNPARLDDNRSCMCCNCCF